MNRRMNRRRILWLVHRALHRRIHRARIRRGLSGLIRRGSLCMGRPLDRGVSLRWLSRGWIRRVRLRRGRLASVLGC